MTALSINLHFEVYLSTAWMVDDGLKHLGSLFTLEFSKNCKVAVTVFQLLFVCTEQVVNHRNLAVLNGLLKAAR